MGGWSSGVPGQNNGVSGCNIDIYIDGMADYIDETVICEDEVLAHVYGLVVYMVASVNGEDDTVICTGETVIRTDETVICTYEMWICTDETVNHIDDVVFKWVEMVIHMMVW